MPPPEVGVIVARPQKCGNKVLELSGRTSGHRVSEVRPQAGGVTLEPAMG